MKSSINTLFILELIADLQPVGVNELTEKLQQPKTNIQRTLSTLHKAGWIRKAHSKQKGWVLTSKLFLLAQKSSNLSDLHSFAVPLIRSLNKTSEETVFLSLLDSNVMTVSYVIQGSKGSLAVVAEPGENYPLSLSAPGKACLAAMGDNDIQAYVDFWRNNYPTSPAIEKQQLLKEMAKINLRGYAIVDGVVSEHVVTVGACFFDATQQVYGGVGISMPTSRVTRDYVKDMGEKVKSTAHAITEELKRLGN